MLETAATPTEKQLDYIDRNLNQKRSVRLKTCADVYGHWRAYKRTYKKAPQDGIEFQIDYIDTGLALDEQTRSLAPVALALHGAPGSYHDFTLLIHHLSQQKVRVIAPNFPEYIATVKTKVLFRHSADEKAAYLRDFLHTIQVSKIDLLVSHSSAIFPTLLILLNANNEAVAQQQDKRDQAAEHLTKQPRAGSTLGANCKTKVFLTTEVSTIKRADVQGQQQSMENNKPVKQQFDQAELKGAKGSTADLDGEGANEDEEKFEDASDEFKLDGNNNRQKAAIKFGHKSEQQDQQQATSERKIASEQKQTSGLKATPDDDAFDVAACDLNCTQIQQLADTEKGTIKTKRRTKKSDVIVKFNQPIEIKAVALLNPAGHRLPKSMKPTWFKCGSVHVYQHKFGRSLFRKFGPAFLTVVGVPVRVDNMDNVMLSATVMRNSKCQRVSKQLERLADMKIPTLLVFSENDKLIEKEIFYEMTQFMRLNPKNFDVFSDDGNIELSQSSMKDWIRVMVFKAGGHYAYSNYAKTVNQAVSELLDKVRNK